MHQKWLDWLTIPTRASAFDLAAAESTVKIVKTSNKPFLGTVLDAIDQSRRVGEHWTS
jgi:hypothetical protein